MKVLRFVAGLLLLGGLIAVAAMGPTPGPVLRHNLEQDIQANALFYMDLDEMPELEERLEGLVEDARRADR